MNERFSALLQGFRNDATTRWPEAWWTILKDDNLQHATAYADLKALPDTEKGLLMLFLIKDRKRLLLQADGAAPDPAALYLPLHNALMQACILLASDWPFEVFRLLLLEMAQYPAGREYWVFEYPLPDFLQLLQRNVKAAGGNLPADLQAALQTLQERAGAVPIPAYAHFKKQIDAEIRKIQLLAGNSAEKPVPPVLFQTGDVFAAATNAWIQGLPPGQRNHWYRLLALAQTVSGSKPTEKYLKTAAPLLDALGRETFVAVLTDWCRQLAGMKEITVEHPSRYGSGYVTFDVYLYAANIDILKGLIWAATLTPSPELPAALARLVERCYQKMPGSGPVAAALGNAALYALATIGSNECIAQLSRLRLKIRQTNTQKLIEKYLIEMAQRQGIGVADLEDLAVDDCGLTLGRLERNFDGYRAVLAIDGIGKTSLNWFKPDGTPQKSAPTALQEAFGADIKALGVLAKTIQTNTTVQRDRFDRMLRSQRQMPFAWFHDRYLHHGLLSWLCRRLIWRFEQDGRSAVAFFTGETWRDSAGQVVDWIGEGCRVALWHPVQSDVAEVQAWRLLLEEMQLAQPLKQAFREIYLLTEAELNTRIYSNRFAAHLLKQHQFNSLAKLRGWSYRLLGYYDDGLSNSTAALALPECGLRAEFWVNEVNADGTWNSVGIWNYIATDQLRFVRLDGGDPVNLIDVPRQVFSEVLRDVDLFVGVASVGNDPEWQDSGGLPGHRDYWQTYSFGDLSEIAKTRKAVITRLLPRLKIAPIAEVRDRFLVVKGKIRTYKIHLGSTNILMEPNDQYLCIVPDRKMETGTSKVFLPFEGDQGLAVILSKAFMLAEDDKITDRTITSQIGR